MPGLTCWGSTCTGLWLLHLLLSVMDVQSLKACINGAVMCQGKATCDMSHPWSHFQHHTACPMFCLHPLCSSLQQGHGAVELGAVEHERNLLWVRHHTLLLVCVKLTTCMPQHTSRLVRCVRSFRASIIPSLSLLLFLSCLSCSCQSCPPSACLNAGKTYLTSHCKHSARL